jgi:TRAP-type C4-dicarboxylate transport system substrate-binding protein
MSPYVDAYSVFAFPYVFHSEEDLLTYLQDGEKAKELYQELEDTANLVTLGFNCTGTRCLSTKGVPVGKAPADFNGVKIRSMEAQVWQNVISCLGATPVPVAYTELYTALQTGVVQGQDNPIANTVDGKFYEVLDTFYENDHAFLISGYYTNTETWNALPDDYKALFEELMQKYMGDFYHEEILKFREECKKTVEDAGVKIVPQEELDMDAFYASADEMLQKEYLSDEAYAAFVEDVKTTFGY